MREDRSFTEIGILIYPGAQLAAVHGLTDLFNIADKLSPERPRPRLRVSHWELGRRRTVERTFASYSSAGAARPGVVIAPPSLGDPIGPERAAPFARWLKVQHKEAGATLCSVCAGAFLLAEAGLLVGRRVTTHWSYANDLRARFPELEIDADRLLIDDGDIVTAGGLMAWTDLGLTIVERLLGPAHMIETARYMLIDPPGREQSFYSAFSPRLRHGDAAILKVQHWLSATGARQVSVAAMARKAGLEERTFLRRFHRATGLNPTAYCQELRVGRARTKLELSNDNVDEIAWAVGYEDSGAFRKIFQRITGLTPAAYRRRFGSMRG